MASRRKSTIFWIEKEQYEFPSLVEMARKRIDQQSADFWARAALVLLRRIYDLEKEAQTLRQGELFTPLPDYSRRGA